MKRCRGMKNIVVWIAVLVFGLIALLSLNPIAIVEAGQRGVVLRFGAVKGEVLNEGMHWRTPFVERIVKMDVRVQKEQVESGAATKDLQTVDSVIALNFHLDPSKVANIYQQVGDNDAVLENVISPSLQESVKAGTARYTAEELITKRDEVREDIKLSLTQKFTPRGIIIDEFNIVNFSFSDSFEAAIEAKVTAEQSALAAKNKLDQVRFEAEQRVAQAKAEAEAIKIQAQAIQQQGGQNYVQLQAIEKWDGKLPTNFVPGSALPFLNIR